MEKIYTIIGIIVFWTIISGAISILVFLIGLLLKKLWEMDILWYYLGRRHKTELLRSVYSMYKFDTKKGVGKYILKYRLRNIKKLLLFAFVVVIITGCKKNETPVVLQETTYESLGTGYVLSSEFTITEITPNYSSDFFTVKDSKFIFTVEVVPGTTYKVGSKITGIQLDAILSKNNYQIPKF